MKFKGINRDIEDHNLSEDQYSYAANIVLSEQYNSVANEEGNTILSTIQDIIGTLVIKDNILVFHGYGVNSRLSVVTKNNIVVGVTDLVGGVISSFNFNPDYPVIGEYYIDNQGNYVVAFTDNFNTPKIITILQLETSPFIQEANLNQTELFPIIDQVTITPTLSLGNGQLKSGSYKFAIAFIDKSESRTSYSLVSNPVWVGQGNPNTFDVYEGSSEQVTTSNAILLTIDGINVGYNKMSIAVIKIVNGNTIVEDIGDYPVSNTFLYTGSEVVTTLNQEDVYIPAATYVKAKAITQLTNRLYLANLQKSTLIDYQQFANNIRIDYTTTLVNCKIPSVKTDYDKGFQHGEVYAFYIAFVLKNGGLSQAFHIPGRTYISDDNTIDIINVGQPTGTSVGTTAYPKYKTGDTTVSIDSSTGQMGYWENENETYPTTGGFPSTGASPAGINRVRHHRFPNINAIKSRHYSGNNGLNGRYGVDYFSKLGIKVTNVTNIPAEAQGWVILYAKRDFNNLTVLDTSIWNYAGINEEFIGSNSTQPPTSSIETVNEIHSTGGNFRLSGTFVGAPIQSASIRKDYIRWNGPTVLINKPELNSVYVENNLLLSTRVFKLRVDIPANIDSGVALSDYTETTNIGTTGNNVTIYPRLTATGNSTIKWSILGYKYLIHNDPVTNRNSEECLRLHVGTVGYTDVNLLANQVVGISTSGNQLAWSPTGSVPLNRHRQNVYLSSLKVIKSNIYNSFENQTLISTGKINTGAFINNLYGGDVYTGTFCKITTSAENAEQFAQDLDTDDGNGIGMKYYHYYVGESITNLHMRNKEGDLEYESQYFPSSNLTKIFTGPGNFLTAGSTLGKYDIRKPLVIGFNKDYNMLNDTLPTSVYNIADEFVDKFPNRVIRSIVRGEEDNDISWKTFLENDYYEQPKFRGEINNIKGYQNKLILHHERGLYLTKDKTSLATDSTGIKLSSGDLFEIEPTEIVTGTEGYAGILHPLCSTVNKLGYCFIDSIQNKIFIFSDSLKEISSKGLNQFFKQNLTVDYLNTDISTLPNSFFIRSIVGNIVEINKQHIITNNNIKTYYFPGIGLFNQLNIKKIVEYKDYYEIELNTTTAPLNLIDVQGLTFTIDTISKINPYRGYGYSLAFDEKYNRLIVSKINTHIENLVPVINVHPDSIRGIFLPDYLCYGANDIVIDKDNNLKLIK